VSDRLYKTGTVSSTKAKVMRSATQIKKEVKPSTARDIEHKIQKYWLEQADLQGATTLRKDAPAQERP